MSTTPPETTAGSTSNSANTRTEYTTNERPSDLTSPTALPAGASQAEIYAAALLVPSAVDLAIQKEEILLYVTKKSILASNVNTIFAKVWGQCSEGL